MLWGGDVIVRVDVLSGTVTRMCTDTMSTIFAAHGQVWKRVRRWAQWQRRALGHPWRRAVRRVGGSVASTSARGSITPRQRPLCVRIDINSAFT